MSCRLCMLDKNTYVYQENDKFIILDCMDCNMPMVVWKKHTMNITDKDAREMETNLKFVARYKLGQSKFVIDKEQKTIPHHLHWHAKLK